MPAFLFWLPVGRTEQSVELTLSWQLQGDLWQCNSGHTPKNHAWGSALSTIRRKLWWNCGNEANDLPPGLWNLDYKTQPSSFDTLPPCVYCPRFLKRWLRWKVFCLVENGSCFHSPLLFILPPGLYIEDLGMVGIWQIFAVPLTLKRSWREFLNYPGPWSTWSQPWWWGHPCRGATSGKARPPLLKEFTVSGILY